MNENEIRDKLRKIFNDRYYDERLVHSITYSQAQLTTIDHLLSRLKNNYEKSAKELNDWKCNILESVEKDILEIENKNDS